MKPTVRPLVAMFSSGPCAKRPGWSVGALGDALVGRSHRAKPGKQRLVDVIEATRCILGIPADFRIGIVAGSDTGAIELALWSLLGARPVDVLAWESFGKDWVTDVVKQLKLKDVRTFEADYGALPALGQVDFGHDVVFTWNGTTSGVRVPNGDWIAADRQGLTLCDATSAAFAMALPWDRLDVTTFSWQKVLGGEAQHGMLVLSPRAVARLESYSPPWPMPKIFRLTKGGKLNEAIFKGETINTPSMLCVEDYRDALAWADSVGGLKGLIARSEGNLASVASWVARTPWIDFLAARPETRSCTSVCLRITDGWFAGLPAERQAAISKQIAERLDTEGVAYDIASYRDAPPGLRIWAGATIERSDLEALFPWIEWAYAQVREAASQSAA
jgi:phosphoserine aminotransferase